MKRILTGLALIITAGCFATAANASGVVVTPGNPQGWSSPAGENSANASAAITSTSAHDGVGSIELSGDRTRFVLGDLYSPASNLGLLSTYKDLGFSYRIDPTSTNSISPGYSPALRITYWDNGVQSEFIFEQAYQPGAYGAEAPIGDWNVTAADATFYKKGGSVNTEMTLADWIASASSTAYVSAIYVGNGSGEGDGYHAYVDDIRAGGSVFNFETGGVPEPASWAMMIVGLGGVGAVMRRRRNASATFA